MTSHEENRAALIRERAARHNAYSAAIAELDALPADTDVHTFRRAEARVGLALDAMKGWGDPVPDAVTSIGISSSVAPEGYCSLSRPAGAADPVEATAARILASDTVPGEGRKDAEVDAIAARIAAA